MAFGFESQKVDDSIVLTTIQIWRNCWRRELELNHGVLLIFRLYPHDIVLINEQHPTLDILMFNIYDDNKGIFRFGEEV